MAAHELFRSLNKTRRSKVKKMGVKLDMSKFYDRVEWPYPETVMKAFGFTDQWVKLIMSCLSTVNYSVLVNDKLDKLIFASRGQRRGDPLSHVCRRL